jgi:hypothetical protein
MADSFQRVGSVSNAHVGRDFERKAKQILNDIGLPVEHKYSVEVGIGACRKKHNFDLGSADPAVIVECKSHRWTSGNNVPSAKLTAWNEAMYYFHCSPTDYRKIFFVLRDEREKTGETLTSYYIRTNFHLIPDNVEIWEFDETTNTCEVLHGT